jgi:hypothetical protein
MFLAKMRAMFCQLAAAGPNTKPASTNNQRSAQPLVVDTDAAGPLRPPISSTVAGTTIVTVKSQGCSFLSGLSPEEMTGKVQFISWVTDQERKQLPVVPSAGYVGVFVERKKNGQIFLANLAYLEFLHFSLAEIGPQFRGFVAAAKTQKSGMLYILDGRFPDNDKSIMPENLPTEEVIGAFGINDGLITVASYRRNANYKVISEFGLARIPDYLRAQIIGNLVKCPINFAIGRSPFTEQQVEQ